MWKRFLCPLALALLVALSGVISAGTMAPDRAAPALRIYELAFGPVDAGLCTEGPRHEHRCPFCHGLPEAPETAHDGPLFLLTPHDGWRQREDLYRAVQARNINHSPRAPPAIA